MKNLQHRIQETIREDCKQFVPHPSILRRDAKGQANLIRLGTTLCARAKTGYWFEIKGPLK